MATVRQIIDWVDRYYPNSVSDANKIIDLDHLHKEIYVILKRLTHDYSLYETSTIANVLTYMLPTNCSIENVVSVLVSKDLTVTNSTSWNKHEYVGLDENINAGYYYGHVPNKIISLLSGGLPYTTTGYKIKIYYYKEPISLSSVTDVPELKTIYHNLLKYKLIQITASQGHNPDVDISNYYQRLYDEKMNEVKNDLTSKFNSADISTQRTQEAW